MRREIPIEDLQRLYSANDMVKADCRGCQGCSDCCSGMGESVVLDPLDCLNLEKGLGLSFSELLESRIELNVVDGVILPNLKMAGEKEICGFLDQAGRCSIHTFRPGICRLFPLGRYYQDGHFSYILQSHECPMENKSKVKISKWLGIPGIRDYENYICKWHYLLKDVEDLCEEKKDEQLQRDLSSYLLEQFYVMPFVQEQDFYSQFEERYVKMKKLLGVLGK